MKDDLFEEIRDEMRTQNELLESVHQKQSEAVWYLWVIAVLLFVALALPKIIDWLT